MSALPLLTLAQGLMLLFVESTVAHPLMYILCKYSFIHNDFFFSFRQLADCWSGLLSAHHLNILYNEITQDFHEIIL